MKRINKRLIYGILVLAMIIITVAIPTDTVKVQASETGTYDGYDTYVDWLEASYVGYGATVYQLEDEYLEHGVAEPFNHTGKTVREMILSSERGYIIPEDCVSVLCYNYGRLPVVGYKPDGTKVVIYDSLTGCDASDYDSSGYDRDGYDFWGYDREGYGRDGYNKDGYDRNGYGRDGYNKEGYNREGYGRDGYNKEGYNRNGYDRDGYNILGYDASGYDRDGFDKDGYNSEGYGRDGYDREGYDINGKSKEEKKPIVRINKTNFGDLSKELLKETYDKNKDQWLSSNEINDIDYLKVSYKTKEIRGLNYLTACEKIKLDNYTGKKLTIKDKHIKAIWIESKNDLTITAPNAEYVRCCGKNAKIIAKNADSVTCEGSKSIDISQCNKARIVFAIAGPKANKMILPKNGDALRDFEMCGAFVKDRYLQAGISTIDLTKYKNLLKVEFLHCGFKTIKMNKCTKIKYSYMFDCNSVTSVDMSHFKNFVAGDFFGCKSLRTIKTPPSGKLTKKKGCWWWSKQYKKWIENNKLDNDWFYGF